MLQHTFCEVAINYEVNEGLQFLLFSLQGCYEQLPRQRKLTGQQLNDTEKTLFLGGNKKLRSNGKIVLLRDLRNVQAAAANKEIHASGTL